MTEVKAEGVRRSILEELNKLIGYTMENQVLLDEDVLAVLVRLTKTLGREILVMTNDKSKIEYVGVGDASKVPLDHSRVQEQPEPHPGYPYPSRRKPASVRGGFFSVGSFVSGMYGGRGRGGR